MTHDTVVLDIEGQVATLTLNRPQAYNAFNKEMRTELLDALHHVDSHDGVRVCILKGAGNGFSAGNDIFGDAKYEKSSDLLIGEYLPILDLIGQSDVLFIAQIHGKCAGIASALAMSCDFVVMAQDSALYMAFAAIALVPDGGATWHMMNALGYRRALEAIIEGRNMPAQDCLEAGIANRIAAPEALEAETRAWAQSLTARAPLAVAAAKRLLRSMHGRGFADTLKAEAEEQNALTTSQDFGRGVAAFKAREAPAFKGN